MALMNDLVANQQSDLIELNNSLFMDYGPDLSVCVLLIFDIRHIAGDWRHTNHYKPEA